jgi:hypothetical protein
LANNKSFHNYKFPFIVSAYVDLNLHCCTAENPARGYAENEEANSETFLKLLGLDRVGYSELLLARTRGREGEICVENTKNLEELLAPHLPKAIRS